MQPRYNPLSATYQRPDAPSFQINKGVASQGMIQPHTPTPHAINVGAQYNRGISVQSPSPVLQTAVKEVSPRKSPFQPSPSFGQSRTQQQNPNTIGSFDANKKVKLGLVVNQESKLISSDQIEAYVHVNPPSGSVQGQHDYHFLMIVGFGTTSSVWKCFDQTSRQLVAIKLIDWTIEHLSEEDQENCKREIMILSRLCHPHILQLIEVIEDPLRSFTYIVTDLVQGDDLLTYINKRDALPEKKAKKIVSQILSALIYCHQNSIIHKDVKPENVLIRRDGAVKLCDFGISVCRSRQVMKDSHIYGSPGYIAPETFFDCISDASSDIWGFGVVSGLTICKVNPISGAWEKNYEAMYRSKTEPTLIFPARLSEDSRDFITSLLRVEPSHRMSLSNASRHRWISDKYSKCHSKIPQVEKVMRGRPYSMLGISQAIKVLGLGAGIS